MGNVLAPAMLVAKLQRHPDRPNPTFDDIEAFQKAKEAQDLAEGIQTRRHTGRECEEARMRRKEANQAAERAAEGAKRMRVQMEEAARAARHAQELSEVAANAAREATRLAQEAQRAQKFADAQCCDAEADRALAEKITRTAAEKTQKAIEAKKETEKRLQEGIQPVVMPTLEELAAAKKRIQYREDCFHFAVAGISGSGKSSLVNAFRGKHSRDAGAAAVGVTKATLSTTRYADANPDNPYVWYDIPGARTLKCRDWQYFNEQGLYVFDCIIVLVDNRFTMTDIAILTNARHFKIPTCIVHSKADQHIRNLMMDMGYESEEDDEEDVERRNQLYEAARKQFIEKTRKRVKNNLEDANLADQRVYIVSNTTMLSLVLDKTPGKTVMIDEVELLDDLLDEAHTRRVGRANQRVRLEAERAVREAQDLLRNLRQDVEQDRERARARQEEADRVAARAAEDMERMRTQMAEAAKAAKRAEEPAKALSNTAKEEVERLAREAQEERERSQKILKDAEEAMAAAKEEAGRAQKAADEQRAAAEAGKALAEEMARTAAEEARKANEAKVAVEKRLKEGIQPVVTPTLEELAAAKKRIQYREDFFHFAIAGISGSGKSSLVNAFRGKHSRDVGAAPAGVIVTTLSTTRYADANPDNPYVWYDIPGAGTIKCRDWQYFNEYGLYVFDCIVVLFDDRFTTTDIAILTNARRFKIPTYIVCSKADQHIRNLMMDMGYESEGDDEEDDERRNPLYKAARKQFIEKTRRSVKNNLEVLNLVDQQVYIVSNTALLSVVLNKIPEKSVMFDEVDLLNDLLNEAHKGLDARASGHD